MKKKPLLENPGYKEDRSPSCSSKGEGEQSSMANTEPD
jgi:hypothetical protein